MTTVAGDRLVLASYARLDRVGLHEVGDRVRATAGIGDRGDLELRAAGVITGLDRGQDERDRVAVAVGDVSWIPGLVVEEGDPVGSGESPPPRRVGRRVLAQVEVDTRSLAPVHNPVGVLETLEAVLCAVAVAELDPAVGAACDPVVVVGADFDRLAESGEV